MMTYEAISFYLVMLCVIQIDYRSVATVYQGDKEADLEIDLNINLNVVRENVVSSRTSKAFHTSNAQIKVNKENGRSFGGNGGSFGGGDEINGGFDVGEQGGNGGSFGDDDKNGGQGGDGGSFGDDDKNGSFDEGGPGGEGGSFGGDDNKNGGFDEGGQGGDGGSFGGNDKINNGSQGGEGGSFGGNDNKNGGFNGGGNGGDRGSFGKRRVVRLKSGRQLMIDASKEDIDCIDYTIDECSFDEQNFFEESKDIKEEVCQQFCAEIYSPNCTFYIFERKQKNCKLFNSPINDYVSTCSKYAGPPTSSVTKCLPGMSMLSSRGFDRPDACKYHIEGSCRYLGESVEHHDNMPSAENCQKACRLHEKCKYWVYDKDTKNCAFYNSDAKNCDVARGPPKPEYTECFPSF